MDFAPGDRFKDFEVIEKLGEGGFGAVYLCTWEMDNREYAVKVLDRGIAEAQREFKALMAISHRNVVKCVHAGSIDDGGWYLQCEYVPGESLARRVRAGERFDFEEVFRIATQLLDGLEAIHPDAEDVDRINELKSRDELTEDEFDELAHLEQQGHVHRDIKPENVMIAEDGRVVIIDFGISSKAGSTVDTSSATPGYLPPDLVHLPGDRWRPDVDLYAAGAVIYELLCGYHPYHEGNDGTGPKTPPLDMSPGMALWLREACAVSRQDRFQSAAEMRDELYAATADYDFSVDESPDGAVGAEESDAWGSVLDLCGIEPYDEWTGSGEGDTDDELMALVLAIVAVEQPVVCARLYRVVYGSLGLTPEAAKSRLNRLIFKAVRSGHLVQVEPLGQGQIDKTVYLPDAGEVGVRELGPRGIWEYPRIELAELLRNISEYPRIELPELLRRIRSIDNEKSFANDEDLLTSIVCEVFHLDEDTWEARYLAQTVSELANSTET